MLSDNSSGGRLPCQRTGSSWRLRDDPVHTRSRQAFLANISRPTVGPRRRSASGATGGKTAPGALMLAQRINNVSAHASNGHVVGTAKIFVLQCVISKVHVVGDELAD